MTTETNTEAETKRFVIVGLGGTGGWLLEGIARIAEANYPGSTLLLIDGDQYEPSNANRQVFHDYGPKAFVKAQMVRDAVPNTIIAADMRWVVEEAHEDDTMRVAASSLLQEGDVVYAMVDNFAARKAIFDAARQFDNIDVFTGGNDDALFGSVYHYERRDGEDVTEHPVVFHEQDYTNPPDRNPGDMSCEERSRLVGGTQTIAANMAVAAALLARTEKVVVAGEPDSEASIMFDFGAGRAAPYDRRAAVLEQQVPAAKVASTT